MGNHRLGTATVTMMWKCAFPFSVEPKRCTKVMSSVFAEGKQAFSLLVQKEKLIYSSYLFVASSFAIRTAATGSRTPAPSRVMPSMLWVA